MPHSPSSYVISRRRFLQTGLLGLSGHFLGRTAPAEEPDPLPALPALRSGDRIDGPPIVSARAWAIADGRTGRFLFGGNETAALAIASTTKIMTAWVVLSHAAENRGTLDEMMTISANAAATIGSSARIRAGDRLPVRELLYGLLLPSGNDAATAFAEHFGPRFRAADSPMPPIDAFVARMNRLATELRLGETRYLDPHGLGANRSSARDLAKLGWTAMQDPVFRGYVRTRRHQGMLTGADGMRRTQVWNNTNRLLEMEGFDGLKTGTTSAAGSCLVASGRHREDHLIAVVLGCTSNDSRYVDIRNLFRWAWRERAPRP